MGDGDQDGYKDYGQEVWDDDEYGDNGKKKVKGNKSIPGFFLQSNKDSKAKKTVGTLSRKKPGVTNDKSNAVMDDLLKKLDDDQGEQEIGGKYEPEDEGNTGYNIYDQMDQQFDVPVPTLPGQEKEEVKETAQADANNDQVMEDVEEERVINDNKENQRDHAINSSENNDSHHNFRSNDDVEMSREDLQESGRGSMSTYNNAMKEKTLPVNENETLNVFWVDAHEEFNNQREAFLFGKVFDSTDKEYRSICVRVRGIERIMYIVPHEGVDIKDVVKEIGDIIKKRFSYIKAWK